MASPIARLNGGSADFVDHGRGEFIDPKTSDLQAN
jgi:hypothetical protein